MFSNRMSEDIPIVTVYRNEQSYEMLSQLYEDSQKDYSVNRPSSPLQRVLTDVLGFVLLNAVTFVLTDLMRGAFTGERPGLWWFWYGPWYFITGAPLMNNIVDVHRLFVQIKDKDHTLPKPTPEELAQHQQHCNDEYDSNKKKCCDKTGGEIQPEKQDHCYFNVFEEIGGAGIRYQNCLDDAQGLRTYCRGFQTDEQYERAVKMHEDHPYIFDLFYLFNYGTLPPFVDLPWPF